MSDLAGFLAARLDEIEAAAAAEKKRRGPWRFYGTIAGVVHNARSNAPSAIDRGGVREVEADRELLARYEMAQKALPGRYKDGFVGALEQVMEIRAQRFSEHPDYRQEWGT